MGCTRTALRLETLATAGRPLRLSELAAACGCSMTFLRKCIDAETLDAGRVGREYRVNVAEAVRFARDELRLLRD